MKNTILIFEGRQQNTSILTTAVVEAFNKELEKLLFKPMDAQELQNPKKVSIIWVKNKDLAVKRLNKTVSSMVGMKPKDVIKLDTVPLDKKISRRDRTTRKWIVRYLYYPGKQHGDQKNEQQTLFGVKIRISYIELYNNQVIVSCIICRIGLIKALCVKN